VTAKKQDAAEMLIRRLKESDIDALAAIHTESFGPPDAGHFGDVWQAREISGLLRSLGGFGVVASVPGEGVGTEICLGFILCCKAGDECEVLTLCVDPSYRRRGVARRMIEDACAGAYVMGAGRMVLEVAEKNLAACALYDEIGFERVGRRKNYYKGRAEGALEGQECGDALILQCLLKA
jgi:[ribosomal protein S18]-alanine N-acetyltransferase